MKIVITENRRNEVITKWLDKNYGDLSQKTLSKFSQTTYYVDELDNDMFSYSYGDVTIEDSGLQSDLFNVLGLNRYNLNLILKPWIEKTYGIDVDLVQYTTWHCNNCGKYHPTKYHIDD